MKYKEEVRSGECVPVLKNDARTYGEGFGKPVKMHIFSHLHTAKYRFIILLLRTLGGNRL